MKRIVVLDDDEDLRNALCEVIEMLGTGHYSCLGVASYEEVLRAADQCLQSEVAILDINLGPNQPTGLDVYRWLVANHYSGKIVFLTGHAATHPLVREAAEEMKDTSVLAKPVAISTLGLALSDGDAT